MAAAESLDISYPHLREAFAALRSGQLSCPHIPSSMWVPNPSDNWDDWENEHHIQEKRDLDRLWCEELNAARRVLKLRARRVHNPSYCVKSDANLDRTFGQRPYGDCRPMSWPARAGPWEREPAHEGPS